MQTFRQQLKANAVAIISLVVAIIALLYNTWREENTERNRNYRLAAFEVLKNLGELQQVVNASYYQHNNQEGNPMLGWGHIALIGDLSQLLPPPVPEKANNLVQTWQSDWMKIKTDEASVDRITEGIDQSREVVLRVMSQLK